MNFDDSFMMFFYHEQTKRNRRLAGSLSIRIVLSFEEPSGAFLEKKEEKS